MGADSQVRTPADGRTEITSRDAHAHSLDEVHRVRTRARRRRIVRILAAWKSQRPAGLEERRLPRRELSRGMPADWNRAVLRVPFAAHVEVVFEALEGG